MLITISNLYPRPDKPTLGMYNYYLFREMSELLCPESAIPHPASHIPHPASHIPHPASRIPNLCLVPEWRPWRWPAIRRWNAPDELISCQVAKLLRERPAVSSGSSFTTQQLNPSTELRAGNPTTNHSINGAAGTVYVPVFTLPLIGRSINWWFYAQAVRRELLSCQVAKLPPPAHGEEISCQVAKLLRESANASSSLPSTTQPCVAKAMQGRQPNNSTTQQPNNSTTKGREATFYVPWLYPDGVAVAQAIRGTGARLWLMALGSDTFHLKSPLRRKLILAACRDAEGIICVANVLADRLAAAGIPRTKLHVVPNGVDTALFRVRNKAELLSCSVAELSRAESPSAPPTPTSTTQQLNNSTTILYVGNLVPVKGADLLLEAVAMLEKRLDLNGAKKRLPLGKPTPDPSKEGIKSVQTPNEFPSLEGLGVGSYTEGRKAVKRCHSSQESKVSGLTSSPSLTLIGDGPERGKLEQLAKQLGIADRVQFLGRRTPEEVVDWMNRATCLCLPSRSEGMPNVVLEARACGCPVVATPAGAIPELPLSRDHFLVTRDASAASLAEGLREMLTRDLSNRTPDPAIPTWNQQARKILERIHAL